MGILASFGGVMLLAATTGGVGLPLGIPPGPEDPVISRVAPEQCLFYTNWTGTASPAPNSKCETEQMLAEPEVQQFLRAASKWIGGAMKNSLDAQGDRNLITPEEAADLLGIWFTHPTAIFVSSLKIEKGKTDDFDLGGGMVVSVGGDGRIKAVLEKYGKMLVEKKGNTQTVQIAGQTWYRAKIKGESPVVTWGIKGEYFIVGVGEGSVEGILARMDNAPPAWLTAAWKQVPVQRPTGIAYFNIKMLRETLLPLAEKPQEAKAVIEMLGLDNATALIDVTGLEESGMVTKTLLALDGEPRGLLRLVSDRPLRPADLAPIPRDATWGFAARFDLQQALDIVRSSVEKMGPEARANFDQGLTDLERQLGIDLRHGLLGSLGDTWCVYNSPGEGGFIFTGLTAVVPLRDQPNFVRAYSGLVAKAKEKLAPAQNAIGPAGPNIQHFRFANCDVDYINAGYLAPACCATNRELIFALSPQNVKAYLARQADGKSLADAPEVARWLGTAAGPAMISYCDTPKMFELLYPFVTWYITLTDQLVGQKDRWESLPLLPSTPAIARHLKPSLTTLARGKQGIELTARYSIPGMGGVGPIIAMPLMSVVPGYLGDPVRQSQELPHATPVAPPVPPPVLEPSADEKNLKQIGEAIQKYIKDKGTLPPAFTTGKHGEALLSWRVAILPYLGQEALYKQFHLDEPWDSDHNHKLTAQMPDCFSSDKNDKSEKTTYLAVRGENTVFAGKLAIRSEEIKDGLATTIMVVQADRAVVWTKPDDFEYRKEFPEIGLNGISFYALFCDGAVRCLPTAIDYWQLRAMYTRAGGEQPLDVKDIPTAPRLPPGLPPTPVPPLKPPVPAAPGSPAPGGYPYAPPAATPAPGDRPAVAPPVPPGKEGT